MMYFNRVFKSSIRKLRHRYLEMYSKNWVSTICYLFSLIVVIASGHPFAYIYGHMHAEAV